MNSGMRAIALPIRRASSDESLLTPLFRYAALRHPEHAAIIQLIDLSRVRVSGPLSATCSARIARDTRLDVGTRAGVELRMSGRMASTEMPSPEANLVLEEVTETTNRARSAIPARSSR
jgi:hypothetical protein